MAVITSRPGGRRASEITPAPSYAGVVSKYANIIENAIEEENNARIQKLILDYQTGALPWNEFLTAFNAEIDKQPDGSTKKVDLQTTLAKLTDVNKSREFSAKRSELEAQYSDGGITASERYTIENTLLGMLDRGTEDYNNQLQTVNKTYDNAIVEKVDKLRADLLNQYSPSGITDQERLNIVEQLLKIPPQDSEAYRSLIGEKASILTDIQKQREKSTGEDLTAARQLFEQADYFEKQTQADFETGRIGGAEFDTQNLENWKAVQDAMQGLKGQVEGKTLGYINSKIETLQQQVTDRQSGKLLDVVVSDPGEQTKIQAVKLSDIVGGLNVGAEKPFIQYDAKGDLFNVIDPRTGKVAASAGNKADAINAARQNKVPGVIQVNTPNGVQSFAQDRNSDSSTYNDFLRINPTTNKAEEAFAAIPTTPDQEKSFRVNIDSDMINKSMSGQDLNALQRTSLNFNQFTSGLGNKIGSLAGQAAKKVSDLSFAPAKAIGDITGFKPGASKINYAALGGPTSLSQSFNQAKEATTTGIKSGANFLGSLGQKVGSFVSTLGSNLRAKTQDFNKRVFNQ